MILLALALIGTIAWIMLVSRPDRTVFNGERAYADVIYQVQLGPRLPGSQAHEQAAAYIVAKLEAAGWTAEIQETEWLGFSVSNIVARRGDADPQIVLGAHYDSRIFADQDSGPARSQAVPGANDGASGVAILLELARTLPADSVPVWLVFFDAEDNGGIEGRDWIMGSRAFAASLTGRPEAVVILDMVGDASLNLYLERNSDPALAAEIWAQAAALGYEEAFITTGKYSLLDDHTPFLEAGIPAVDIIDFDYPYWHTTADTVDKVSAASLKTVGETLLVWIAGWK